MKRSWLLILLVSVGLNLGFAWQLWQKEPRESGLHDGHRVHRRLQHEDHWPAKGDTAAWREMGRRRMDRVATRLGLAPEQAEIFRKFHEETVHHLGDKRALVTQSRDELRTLLAAAVVDSAAVRRTLHELGRRQAVLDSLVTESFMKEMSVLDPEQREHYLRMMPFGGDPGPEGRPRRGRGRGRD